MTWDKRKKKQVEPPKRETFFKPGKAFVHDQGLKVMVWGDYETGKSYFGASAPEPVYVLDTEFGMAPILRHFPDKEIYLYEAAILDESTDEPDIEMSLKNLEQAVATLKDVESGTIVIDSGTDIWQWLGAWVEQQARKAGKMTSVGPQRLQWGRANLRWRQLILRLMAKPVHFVITAQVAEMYDSKGQALGEYRPRIQKQTSHMCDIVLHLEKRYSTGKKPMQKFMATFTKCRFQRALDLEIEDVTFDKLCQVLKDKLGVVVTGATVG